MNYLVYLDSRAGELEKILSGLKTMIIKEFDPDKAVAHSVNPGDNLYFLKDQDDSDLRVKATVVRVLPFTNHSSEDLAHTLKEMQPRLQLTEEQYNHWYTKRQALLIEFGSAQKIGVIPFDPGKLTDRSGWITFESFSLIR